MRTYVLADIWTRGTCSIAIGHLCQGPQPDERGRLPTTRDRAQVPQGSLRPSQLLQNLKRRLPKDDSFGGDTIRNLLIEECLKVSVHRTSGTCWGPRRSAPRHAHLLRESALTK